MEKRRLLLDLWGTLPQKLYDPSTEEIDVVIPVIEKDLSILPLCLTGIRRCITNNIKSIYLVAPPTAEIEIFAKENDCIFVNEGTVLDGLTPRDLNLIVHSDGKDINRSGWLFQQLLKMSANIGTCNHYVTIDSDHILIQQHTFLAKDDKPVLYLSEERNPAYRDNIHRLLPNSKINLNPWSFVAHKMLFSKKLLKQLQNQIIAENNGNTWIEAILKKYDHTQISGFSEFELYGNFIKQKHLLPWKQIELRYEEMDSFDGLVNRYSSKYRSVTFPEWKNK